jgi:alkylation response protein AidB-like acyl-CoA dehydrogenase
MYKAPLEDYQFVLDRVIGFDALMALIGNDDVNQELADAVLEEAGKLAGDVIAPLNHSGDLTGAKRQDNGQVITPDGFSDAYAAMGQGGWTAMEAGEDFGGQNLPMTLTTAVNELWQSANMAFALCHLLTQGQIYALQKSASPELQNIFIPPMVEGRWTGTMNLTEPQAGTDLAGIKSRAVPNGDHYLISGQKIYITYGEHDMAENIIHLVLARTRQMRPMASRVFRCLSCRNSLLMMMVISPSRMIFAVCRLRKNLASRDRQPRLCSMVKPMVPLAILSVRKIRGSTSCLA